MSRLWFSRWYTCIRPSIRFIFKSELWISIEIFDLNHLNTELKISIEIIGIRIPSNRLEINKLRKFLWKEAAPCVIIFLFWSYSYLNFVYRCSLYDLTGCRLGFHKERYWCIVRCGQSLFNHCNLSIVRDVCDIISNFRIYSVHLWSFLSNELFNIVEET